MLVIVVVLALLAALAALVFIAPCVALVSGVAAWPRQCPRWALVLSAVATVAATLSISVAARSAEVAVWWPTLLVGAPAAAALVFLLLGAVRGGAPARRRAVLKLVGLGLVFIAMLVCAGCLAYLRDFIFTI